MMPIPSKVEQPGMKIPVAPHPQHLLLLTDCLMLGFVLVLSYCGKCFVLF